MKRTAVLALVAVMVSLLLAGGVALAKDITCGGGECLGTEQADAIEGTDGNDRIFGLGGADTITGDTERIGGSDLIRGGAGPDVIRDRSFGDLDAVFGGKGNDSIDVRDDVNGAAGGADVVDCGDGKDTVFFDPDDTVKNCERKNPGDGTAPI